MDVLSRVQSFSAINLRNRACTHWLREVSLTISSYSILIMSLAVSINGDSVRISESVMVLVKRGLFPSFPGGLPLLAWATKLLKDECAMSLNAYFCKLILGVNIEVLLLPPR